MTDLTTFYLGMKLRSPLVASASPLSRDVDGICRLEEAGASAIVLYSLFEEQLRQEEADLEYHLNAGTESFAESITYLPRASEFYTGPEGYLEHIRKAKKAVGIPIIASLNGSTLGGWTRFASEIERAGADAIECNIYYIPTDPKLSAADVEQTYFDILQAVKNTVSIPVAVKLSPFFSNMANMAHRLDAAGADALVLFNRFYQPDINLDELAIQPNVLLSTPQALRLPLTWIGILHGRVKAGLAATGGVHGAEDVIKLLMVGASVTMMCSSLMRHGINHLRHVERELREWMEEHEYESVAQMQGSMSQIHCPDPGAFERAQYMRGQGHATRSNGGMEIMAAGKVLSFETKVPTSAAKNAAEMGHPDVDAFEKARRERRRALILPREHGAWGLLLVPMITGAGVALRQGGSLFPFVALLTATLTLFWMRTPLESLLGTSAMRAETAEERREVAFVAGYLGVVAALALGLLLRSGNFPLLWPLAGAACVAFAGQALLKKLGRRARMLSEIVGTIGLAVSGPTAYYVITGKFGATAWMLWLANLIFAGDQIHYVQLRIHTARVEGVRAKFARGWAFAVGQVAMLGVLVVACWRGLMPWIALVAFAPLLFRGWLYFFEKPGPLQVRRLGWSELGQATAFCVLFIAAFAISS